MKNTVFFLVLCASAVGCNLKSEKVQVPFPNPQNLSQKVANLVTTEGGELRFFEGYSIYVLTTGTIDKKSLKIDYYSTNRRFSAGLSAKDEIAETLIMGTPKIFMEIHVWDSDTDGRVNGYQSFRKWNGPVLVGFSREERDSSKSGVRENLVDGGMVWKSGQWVKASPKVLKDIQEEYEFLIKAAARHFNLIK